MPVPPSKGALPCFLQSKTVFKGTENPDTLTSRERTGTCAGSSCYSVRPCLSGWGAIRFTRLRPEAPSLGTGRKGMLLGLTGIGRMLRRVSLLFCEEAPPLGVGSFT